MTEKNTSKFFTIEQGVRKPETKYETAARELFERKQIGTGRMTLEEIAADNNINLKNPKQHGILLQTMADTFDEIVPEKLSKLGKLGNVIEPLIVRNYRKKVENLIEELKNRK